MKTWKIPVTWGMMGFVKVEADTLEEAIVIAKDEAEEIPLPDDGDYVCGSWGVDCDDADCIRELYNDGQVDDHEEEYVPMKTLEDVLRQQFGCAQPFLDDPYYDEDECAPVTFTDEGSSAYTELINLVQVLGNLTGCDVNRMVDQLDRIASEL